MMEVFKTNFKHEKWIEVQSLLRTASKHYAKHAPAGPNSPEHLLASLLTCIENAPNGKNIPVEWIAVKDRLPEMDVQVLVFRDGCFAVSEIYMNDLKGNPMWDYTGIGGDPLYWMPLPEPPKD